MHSMTQPVQIANSAGADRGCGAGRRTVRRGRRVRPVVAGLLGAATIMFASGGGVSAGAGFDAQSASSCVVDVSDWPIGILPDSAAAAFGSSATAACAVTDWPMGVLPDDATAVPDA